MKPTNTNTNTQQIERDIEAGAAAISSEQNADRAALLAMVGEVQPAPGQDTEQPQGPDLAGELSGLMAAAVHTLKPAFPSLGEIYTEETIGAASAAVAAVCTKHGWLGGGMFGQYGEEIACIAVVGPLAFATYKGVSGDLEKMRAKKQQQQGPRAASALNGPDLSAPMPQAPDTPKTVTFGGVAA